MALTLYIATDVVRAGVTKAAAHHLAVNIAVVAAGGRLIAFSRMEAAEPVGTVGAPGKASLSAAFAASSGELRDAAQEPWARGLLDVLGTQVMVWSGAEPIFEDGRLVGAVGVAGAGPKDAEVARDALSSVGLLRAP